MDGVSPRLLNRVRRDLIRRVTRRFAGVEYVTTVRHDDGSATVTFMSFDDNADEVMEELADLADDLWAQGIRVLVVPHE